MLVEEESKCKPNISLDNNEKSKDFILTSSGYDKWIQPNSKLKKWNSYLRYWLCDMTPTPEIIELFNLAFCRCDKHPIVNEGKNYRDLIDIMKNNKHKFRWWWFSFLYERRLKHKTSWTI